VFHLFLNEIEKVDMRVFLVFCSCLFLMVKVSSQTKTTQTLEQVWLGYFNQTRLNDKWGFWLDAQIRTKDNFTDSLSQFIFRPGVTYYIDNNTKLSLGYAFINHFPADDHPDISAPEHRIWQQIQWHTSYSRIRTMQWFRLEERYRRKITDGELGDGYNFNFRMRYNFLMQVPMGAKKYEKGAVSCVINDEIHINFGKRIVYNYFDQNRFFTGFNYFLNKHDNIQFGYMNLFQQLSAGNKYRSIHTARVFFFHNLDLRKKNTH